MELKQVELAKLHGERFAHIWSYLHGNNVSRFLIASLQFFFSNFCMAQ